MAAARAGEQGRRRQSPPVSLPPSPRPGRWHEWVQSKQTGGDPRCELSALRVVEGHHLGMTPRKSLTRRP